MAFSFNWENRVDGQDYVMADDVNNLALGISELGDYADTHISNLSNPHGVTKTQLDLGNVDNTADADKPVSTAQQASINAMGALKVDKSDIVDNLTTGGVDKVLSAEQGKALETKKVNTADIVDDLTTGGSAVPLSAKQGAILQASKADQPYQQHTQTDGSWSVTDSAGGLVKEASISGNTIQNGTPTPEVPIMPVCLPQGTEIKVVGKNVFDGTSVLNAYFTASAVLVFDTTNKTVYTPCLPNTTYTISKTAGQRFAVGYTSQYPSNGVTLFGVIVNATASAITITTGSDAKYLLARIWNATEETAITAEEMIASVQIEKGPVATPYAPYTNPTTLTTPCDLWATPDGLYRDSWNPITGDVIRGINAKIFNGTETWHKNGGAPENQWLYNYRNMTDGIVYQNGGRIFCSHAPELTTLSIPDGLGNNGIGVIYRYTSETNPFMLWLNLGTVIGTNTAAGFKSYVQDQYANNTPVTIWYPLTTPTTEHYPPQPITLPQGVVNMVVESSNGVLPSKVDMLYRQDLQAFVKSIADSIYDTLATNITDLQTRVAALENA